MSKCQTGFHKEKSKKSNENLLTRDQAMKLKQADSCLIGWVVSTNNRIQW